MNYVSLTYEQLSMSHKADLRDFYNWHYGLLCTMSPYANNTYWLGVL